MHANDDGSVTVFVATVQNVAYPFEYQTFAGVTADDAERKARAAYADSVIIDPDDRFDTDDDPSANTFALTIEGVAL